MRHRCHETHTSKDLVTRPERPPGTLTTDETGLANLVLVFLEPPGENGRDEPGGAADAMRLSRISTVVAWGLCAATAALAAGRLGLAIADPQSSDAASGPQVPGGGVLIAIFESVVLLALGVIGALVASRRPQNAVGWILCVIPVSLGLLILSAHAYWSLAFAGNRDAADLTAWLATWIWIPALVSLLALFPLLFPTGRPPTPRWRPVIWVAAVAGMLLFAGVAFARGRFEDYPVDNPLGAGEAFAVVGGLGFVLMLGASVASLASLVIRFRRSHGEERQQLRWVTAAAALFALIFIGDAPIEALAGDDVGFAWLLLGFLGIAVAVAISLLRYRLYDFDVVINRTLVYGTLTAALAGTYLGSVLVLELALGGLAEDSGLAVAGSTLAVAALFQPARRRIQAWVDRRFYRRRFDSARTLERFGGYLRNEVELDSLSLELRAVVAETMQPAHVSLWLRSAEADR